MLRLSRASVPLATSVVSAALLLAGCTSASPEAGASPAATGTSAGTSSAGPSSAGSSSSGSSSSGSSSSGSSSSGAPSSGSSSTPAGSANSSLAPLTIAITIADHKVSPSGEKIDVTVGQTVVLTVTSDADDEVHAHTAGAGYELEVKAGVPAKGRFVAADTGSFEIESHHLDKIIAILNVR